MKHLLWGVLFCLVASPMLPGQQGQQRPTLGPTEPSLRGPASATINNRRRLLAVKKIYIDRIDNNLSSKIAAALSKSSMLRIVDKRDEADAVLSGTCFRSRRLKRLHSEVYLNDRVNGSSIWQDIVYVPWAPPEGNKAVDHAAAEIVTHLLQSMREAAH